MKNICTTLRFIRSVYSFALWLVALPAYLKAEQDKEAS